MEALRRRYVTPCPVSLFGRVVAINAGAIIAAALVLVISPVTISARPHATEIAVLAVGTIRPAGRQRLARAARTWRSTTCSTGSSTSGATARAARSRPRRTSARLARELHDEIGQTLTGVVLQLEGSSRAAPPELRAELRSLEASARAGIEEVREIARRLRPEALDDFGLRSALASLAADLAEHSGLRASPRLAGTCPR